MQRRPHLSVQPLEGRDVPATFGIPWPDGTAITVSFAPDGANVDGSPNQLAALMARSGLSTSLWQTQILKAFEAWTVPANINVGVVGDDGSALGAAGNPQADPRFGDIRIFAAPLSTSDLAITTPPGDLAGTRTGDIILNSNYNFGVGTGAAHDLYTVLLQESGHALGVANSPDTSSVMYEFYQGTRAGLSAGDVQSIQKLYGPRSATTWEPSSGNNTATRATPLAGPDPRLAFGDMSTAADVDWYSFTAPSGPTNVTVRTAGLSLLQGRVTVFNTSLVKVGGAAATGTGQDLTLTLNLRPGAKYYVRVTDLGSGPFTVGQYTLTVAGDTTGIPTVTVAGQTPVDDAYSNESSLTATRLGNVATGGGTAYQVFGHLRANDVDTYTVRSPIPGLNQANVLTASVRVFGALAPQLTVTDGLGLPVASATVTADGDGIYTVEVPNALAATDYHVAVNSRTGTVGDYEFRASYRSTVTAAHTVASGLLTILSPSVTNSIQVTGSAQIYFELSSALTPIIGPAVAVKIYDANNHLKFQLLARAGDTVGGAALLGPGTYRVVISGVGGLLPSLLSAYTLKTALLTDPTGVPPSDPNDPGSGGTSDPPPPSGYDYYNDKGYFVWGERTPTGGGG